MAPSTAALDFTAMIKADRKKRQAETLANQILGSGKNKQIGKAAGTAGGSRGNGGAAMFGVSLASRVGVQKRTASTSKPNINGKWNHDLHHSTTVNPRPAPRASLKSSDTTTKDRNNHLYASLQSTSTSNPSTVTSKPPATGASMSIRGMASPGPFVVIASNFAPGTTAADIQAAMEPVGGEIEICRLLSVRPTVMAEIVFLERSGAENVIATFNNQKADGRTLYVYLKPGGPSPDFPTPGAYSQSQSQSHSQARAHITPSTLKSAPTPRPRSPIPITMDIDDEPLESSAIIKTDGETTAIPTQPARDDQRRNVGGGGTSSGRGYDERRGGNGNGNGNMGGDFGGSGVRRGGYMQDGRYGFGGNRYDEGRSYGSERERGLYSDRYRGQSGRGYRR